MLHRLHNGRLLLNIFQKKHILRTLSDELCSKLGEFAQSKYLINKGIAIDNDRGNLLDTLCKEFNLYKTYKEEYESFEAFQAEINQLEDKELIKYGIIDQNRFLKQLETAKRNIEEIIHKFANENFGNQKDLVILEAVSGVGGDDATMFTSELISMYKNFSQHNSWDFQLLTADTNSYGGTRHGRCLIEGYYVINSLEYERGVHRVSRIPFNSDKIHTSASCVIVTHVMDEVKLKINKNDLKVESMLSSGPGGQNVQKRPTAARVTHIPTGIAVHVSQERSGVINKQIATEKLMAQLYNMEYEKIIKKVESERKQQKGLGERHEKIRSYNFVNNRIVDHRGDIIINYNLSSTKNLIDPQTFGRLIHSVKVQLSESKVLQFLNTIK